MPYRNSRRAHASARTFKLQNSLRLPRLRDSLRQSGRNKIQACSDARSESLLPLDAWNEIVAANPILEQMEMDVEALLVNRVGATREYFIVPVDECYKLVGLIRAHWRGLSGGTEVWREINKFYADLREQSQNRLR